MEPSAWYDQSVVAFTRTCSCIPVYAVAFHGNLTATDGEQPTIYEKDDSKWSAHNQDPPGRVFLRPYDRADVPRSSKREHGKNKSRTIGTENGENVDPNDNARDAGAGDESESDEDEEAPVTYDYERGVVLKCAGACK